jgi:hypothetical protein
MPVIFSPVTIESVMPPKLSASFFLKHDQDRIHNQGHHEHETYADHHGKRKQPVNDELINPFFGFGLIFQIWLMLICRDRKTLVALSTRVIIPTVLANQVSVLRAAFSRIFSISSALL